MKKIKKDGKALHSQQPQQERDGKDAPQKPAKLAEHEQKKIKGGSGKVHGSL